MEVQNLHQSVMAAECLRYLHPKAGETFIDATLGLGGHAELILQSAEVRLIGIDQDPAAIKLAGQRLANYGKNVEIFHDNFSALKRVAAQAKIDQADGILADLGVSSLQFDSAERGFSFRFDAPLDMRMDADSDDETAAELLANRSEEEIANIIYQYGEERASRRIARWIVEKRERGEAVETTTQLAKLVERAVGRKPKDKIHPATKTFQALRIAVNGELEILEKFVRDAVDLLSTDGRLAIITFHSLEDRIVKQTLQKLSGKCFCPPRMPVCVCGAEKTVEILTRKPVVPTAQELAGNPRARSAKLRVCVKLAA